MAKNGKSEEASRGIKSVEIGYQVLLAIQQGPAPVQLAEVARRTGLSSGAAHNYIASLVRTGMVEQESRGRYRLGPSAFALSLASFHLLNGYDVLRTEAQRLQTITKENVAVAVWSQGGPVSVFIQRADEPGAFEFRSGLIPMLRSAAGKLAAAYLPSELTSELIDFELRDGGLPGTASGFIAEARDEILPLGYSLFRHEQPRHTALSTAVWTADDRLAFFLSIVANRPSAADTVQFVRPLLESAARASLLIGATGATGPRSSLRVAPRATA